MDLRPLIRPQLWDAISNSYTAENYVTSIQTAILFLSKTIQEKANLDLDGVKLIDHAFGGDEPRLRLNKFQTATEKSEQRGFHSIISGLYSAIRNPRAHEIIKDNKKDADPIIYFVDYLLNKIDIAKPPFNLQEFLHRVFDEDFISSKAYANELVKEIPRKKYLETLIEIYRNRPKGINTGIVHIFPEIANQLTTPEVEELMAVVSKDLDTLNDDDSITLVLRVIPKQSWQMAKLSSRMRIEHKLIKAIRKGKQAYYESEFLNPDGTLQDRGKLGKSAIYIIDQFTLNDELINAINEQLTSGNSERHRYIIFYFLNYLPILLKDPPSQRNCAEAMKSLITVGDKWVKHKVVEFLQACPDDWLTVIKLTFDDITDKNLPALHLRDGSPFLNMDYIDLPQDEAEDFFLDLEDEPSREYGRNEEYF
jgi:uncharacterized protein (TIGR02391 family)